MTNNGGNREEIERQAWAKYAECVHIPKEWRKEMKNCFESAFRKGFEAGVKYRDEQTYGPVNINKPSIEELNRSREKLKELYEKEPDNIFLQTLSSCGWFK